MRSRSKVIIDSRLGGGGGGGMWSCDLIAKPRYLLLLNRGKKKSHTVTTLQASSLCLLCDSVPLSRAWTDGKTKDIINCL